MGFRDRGVAPHNPMLIANPIHDLAAIEVGQHLYWNIGPFTVHGQVLLTTWFVTALLPTLSLVANSQLKSLPTGLQNLTEYTLEFIRDLAYAIGRRRIPILGSIFGNNFSIHFRIKLVWCIAFMTSVAYFYAGLRKKGLGYFARYVEPVAFFLPINVLEDFTKPLSLTFRLFGNILAGELVVGVLLSLVPLFVPVPIMLLGLFTSAIQALVFATLAGAYIGEALEDHH